MRIGFDAKRAFVNSSGLGNYSRNTLNALKKYFPNNRFILFSPEIKDELFKNHTQFETVSLEKSSSKLYKSIWRTFLLSRKLKENALDIFHGLSNELPKGIRKSEVAAVVTIHDLIFFRFPKFYTTVDRKIYVRKTKYACKSANKIIAISQQTKDDIVQFLKIDSSKIVVIHQAVAPVFFEKNSDIYLALKYNLPEKYILSVGTIEQRKNQLSILKALHHQNITIPVIFVGKPTNYILELQNFISENNLKNQVIFLNNIPETDLAGLYQLASLSIYISIFEGFGLPVIESMACHCPVITSNLSCLPETAGDAAVLCDPNNFEELGNKIKQLITDTGFRKKMIGKGVKRAKQFHPKKYSEKLISLYTEML